MRFNKIEEIIAFDNFKTITIFRCLSRWNRMAAKIRKFVNIWHSYTILISSFHLRKYALSNNSKMPLLGVASLPALLRIQGLSTVVSFWNGYTLRLSMFFNCVIKLKTRDMLVESSFLEKVSATAAHRMLVNFNTYTENFAKSNVFWSEYTVFLSRSKNKQGLKSLSSLKYLGQVFSTKNCQASHWQF